MLCELTCTTTRISFVIEKWNELIVKQRFAILLKIYFVTLDICETKLNFASFNNKNLQRQRKLLANVTFPYKTLKLIRLVQCLSYSRDQKFVMSLAQSAITCTQEWNVVQYLVNKTNMDSFQNESLSSIMKIALYTITHLF